MADVPLASVDDLAARASTPLPSTQRATAALVDASAIIRNYCGRRFTRDVTTEPMRVVRDVIVLPELPVHEIVDVVDIDRNPVEWSWNGDDVLYVPGARLVRVTYDHGFDEVPDDVVAVVCNVAARALAAPPETAGLTSESITNYSVGYGAVGASGPAGIFNEERRALDRYRAPAVGMSWML